MNITCTCSRFLIAAAFTFTPLIQAENWPQWRGPSGDGVSSEKNIPVEWSSTKNIEWKTPIPGEGHSSAIVWEDTIFVTTALVETRERLLLRLDRKSGEILWSRAVLKAEREHMHSQNSLASSTPITDGTHVFTSFQNGDRVDIQCFDFNGNRIWTAQPLRFEGEHGYSYTPVLYRDLLIFDFAQNDEAAVIALDKKSGALRWRAPRRTREISHVTPLLVNSAGTRQLIVCGSNEIRSLNPETGESIWWADGPTEVCVAGLAYGNGKVFATGGYSRRTRMAVDVSGRGDVTGSKVAWTLSREVTYVPSPVFSEGFLYTVLDNGLLHCFDAETGESVWVERLDGGFRSSLILADGNIYATNDQGRTTVFRANPKRFQPVAVNELDEFCYATPAISHGRIYLRAGRHVYSIGGGE